MVPVEVPLLVMLVDLTVCLICITDSVLQILVSSNLELSSRLCQLNELLS